MHPIPSSYFTRSGHGSAEPSLLLNGKSMKYTTLCASRTLSRTNFHNMFSLSIKPCTYAAYSAPLVATPDASRGYFRSVQVLGIPVSSQTSKSLGPAVWWSRRIVSSTVCAVSSAVQKEVLFKAADFLLHHPSYEDKPFKTLLSLSPDELLEEYKRLSLEKIYQAENPVDTDAFSSVGNAELQSEITQIDKSLQPSSILGDSNMLLTESLLASQSPSASNMSSAAVEEQRFNSSAELDNHTLTSRPLPSMLESSAPPKDSQNGEPLPPFVDANGLENFESQSGITQTDKSLQPSSVLGESNMRLAESLPAVQSPSSSILPSAAVEEERVTSSAELDNHTVTSRLLPSALESSAPPKDSQNGEPFPPLVDANGVESFESQSEITQTDKSLQPSSFLGESNMHLTESLPAVQSPSSSNLPVEEQRFTSLAELDDHTVTSRPLPSKLEPSASPKDSPNLTPLLNAAEAQSIHVTFPDKSESQFGPSPSASSLTNSEVVEELRGAKTSDTSSLDSQPSPPLSPSPPPPSPSSPPASPSSKCAETNVSVAQMQPAFPSSPADQHGLEDKVQAAARGIHATLAELPQKVEVSLDCDPASFGVEPTRASFRAGPSSVSTPSEVAPMPDAKDLDEGSSQRALKKLQEYAKVAVKGMGPKRLDILVEKGLLTNWVDLYSLEWEKVAKITPLFGEKTAALLKSSVEATKGMPLDVALRALGVPRATAVGGELSEHFGTVDGFRKATVADLMTVQGVSKKTSAAIYSWLQDPTNQSDLDTLHELGVVLRDADSAPVVTKGTETSNDGVASGSEKDHKEVVNTAAIVDERGGMLKAAVAVKPVACNEHDCVGQIDRQYNEVTPSEKAPSVDLMGRTEGKAEEEEGPEQEQEEIKEEEQMDEGSRGAVGELKGEEHRQKKDMGEFSEKKVAALEPLGPSLPASSPGVTDDPQAGLNKAVHHLADFATESPTEGKGGVGEGHSTVIEGQSRAAGEEEDTSKGSLSGKKFVCTGVFLLPGCNIHLTHRRLEERLKSFGGLTQSRVSKSQTDYLIAGVPKNSPKNDTPDSNKRHDAKQFKIPILTPEEFIAMLEEHGIPLSDFLGDGA
eukprot:TRINITY_DN1682_c0_g1_i1.p1 TRINITY_DN1682_c0_g1~~TRINITY_DN1682_c0_g1_i1.p1  ORF type:complete len:1092 (-),score=155.39 TRINITY_DN1682_c0_g1_i1:155-3430(-)